MIYMRIGKYPVMFAALVLASHGYGAEVTPVTLAAQFSKQPYIAGVHESPAAIIAADTDTIVAFLDVTNHRYPNVCVDLELYNDGRFVAGSRGICGRPEGFTSILGRPITAVSMRVTRPVGFSGEMTTRLITNGTIETQTSIAMSNEQPPLSESQSVTELSLTIDPDARVLTLMPRGDYNHGDYSCGTVLVPPAATQGRVVFEGKDKIDNNEAVIFSAKLTLNGGMTYEPAGGFTRVGKAVLEGEAFKLEQAGIRILDCKITLRSKNKKLNTGVTIVFE